MINKPTQLKSLGITPHSVIEKVEALDQFQKLKFFMDYYVTMISLKHRLPWRSVCINEFDYFISPERIEISDMGKSKVERKELGLSIQGFMTGALSFPKCCMLSQKLFK